jgi:alpha-L-fucosidase 2
MKKICILLLIANVLFLNACNRSEQGNLIEKYNISWDSPSKDCSGSMPLGNGDIGINVWVEENGDLFFYISKTDAWGDNARLLKVGKLKVSLTPSPTISSGKFSQILDLQNGSIEIQIGEGFDATNILLWVDANNPAITVEVKSSEPVEVTASVELWRTEQHPIESISHGYIMFNKAKKTEGGLEYPVVIEPDIVLKDQTGRVGWYHHNTKSVGPQFIRSRSIASSHFWSYC